MKLALAMAAVLFSAASGIHPIAPKGAVDRGHVPVFRMKVNGKGLVYVRVCRSDKRANGVICDTEATGRATRGKGGIYTYKPRAYKFASYFANRPGTYYWQAARVICRAEDDCRQVGPVTRFTVR